MSLQGARVYIHGRLRGLTKRRLGRLAVGAGGAMTRRASNATIIALGHNTAKATLSDAGDLQFSFRPLPGAQIVSELSFARMLGMGSMECGVGSFYASDQLAKHSGLSEVQIRALSLFDVLSPSNSLFTYEDLVAARVIGKLVAGGKSFPKIVQAALALKESGGSLKSTKLSEAPWGQMLQEIDGKLAGLNGQLLLPIDGDDVSAEDAFVRGEESESKSDLGAARRWYEIAARLDRSDPVIPFNLANVLDTMGLVTEAAIGYRQALARDPCFPDAWFNLGVMQEREGRSDEALASYERAAAVDQGYVDAQHNAALLLMRLKRFPDAILIWDKIAAAASPAADEAKRLAHLCRLELKHVGQRR
jgi:Tetratricopeptide repeat